jgi:hypothetical protein
MRNVRRFGTSFAVVVLLLSSLSVIGLRLADAQGGDGGGGFRSMTPTRVMDTREGLGGPKLEVGEDRALALPVPGGAAGVVLNVTVTNPEGPGFVAVYPAGTPRPGTSSVNFVAGQTVSNSVTVGVAGSTVLLYGIARTDVVVDVMAYYAQSNFVSSGQALGNGVWLVNSQVEPGRYIGSVAPGNHCYWARLYSTSGRDTIANASLNGPGQVIMDVMTTDQAVQITGPCNLRRQ